MNNTELTGFHKECINRSVPFITYKTPGSETFYTIISEDVHIVNDKAIFDDGNGFLISPFDINNHSYWLNADHIIEGTTIDKAIYDKVIKAKAPYPKEAITLPKGTLKESYIKQVDDITSKIKEGIADKVVLSRVVEIEFSEHKAPELFIQLASNFNHAFTYILSTPQTGIWIGASPELLFSAEPSSNDSIFIKTTALAGTRKSGSTGSWGVKEIKEQEWVSLYISNKLHRNGCKSITKSDAYTSKAGNVEHIRNDFTAIADKRDAYMIISELHPTPAVCGWPDDKSLDIINSTENHKRSLYTGYLGPVNMNHKTELFVNLRCMQISGERAVLYVGGGLTADSVAEDEWMETTNKSLTLLSEIEKLQNLAH